MQDNLAQALEDLRSEYATLQQHFKKASLDLLQARLVVKNIGDASCADTALVAAADAVDTAAAAVAAVAANSGSITPPPRPVSEAAPSAAADGQSSASSYLPLGLAHMLGSGTTRSGAAALPATMQLSAQLANTQIKLKVERQRADDAEAQIRKLQQQLAVASSGTGAANDAPIIPDKLTGVLKVLTTDPKLRVRTCRSVQNRVPEFSCAPVVAVALARCDCMFAHRE